MLSIDFIRENQHVVEQAVANKQLSVDITKLLQLDTARRAGIESVEKIRQERNQHAAGLKKEKPTNEQIEHGKHLKEKLAGEEEKLEPVLLEFAQLLRQVPNVPTDDTPIGTSEDQNVVILEWGEQRSFDFEPKNHWEIASARDWIDKDRASRISGARFAFIKKELVLLQMSLMRYGMDVLGNEEVLKSIIAENNLDVPSTPFVPVLPPLAIKTEAYEATGRLKAGEQTYELATDDLWLNASAEHSLSAMYLNEILEADQLPIRYVGYATSFRREAGTYGQDTEGIVRMHQFDKLEMESFTSPDKSLEEHMFLVAVQEYLMQQLELPYRKLLKCTADIGFPNARGVDIDVWLPGQQKYRETHTADYMTDFQTQGTKTRIRREDGSLVYAHTNDATAFSQRPLIAIIENNQTADMKVGVPKVLQSYMGGKTEL